MKSLLQADGLKSQIANIFGVLFILSEQGRDTKAFHNFLMKHINSFLLFKLKLVEVRWPWRMTGL